MHIFNLFLLITLFFSATASAKTSSNGDQAYCSQYAQTAVSQYQQNLQQQCGFTGLRWSNNEAGQMQWCLTVRRAITAKENQARQQALEHCNKLKTNALNALKIKSHQSSIVQQLFPQKAVMTNVQKLGFSNLNTFLKAIRIPTFNFALSHSGRWLAQGGDSTNDSTLKFWDLKRGKLLYLLGEEKGSAYIRLSFSPDEKFLIAGNNETTDIWDWKKARLLFRLKNYFLPPYQAFDANQKLYLIDKDRHSVARFDLSNGLQEAKWKFAENFEEIRSFAVSAKGNIAVTTLKSRDVILKVFNTQTQKLIYSKNIPPYSIYNNQGNYPSGRLLGFIDNQQLTFYSLESLNAQPQISKLNLSTMTIEKIRTADDSGINIKDLTPQRNQYTTQAQKNKTLCPISTPQLGWDNINDIQCELKTQAINADHIVSNYKIKHNGRYLNQTLILHDSTGNIVAYFGADSNARWFWLDAQTGELKNSGALWSDTVNPNRKPNIYHFPAHTVPLKLNQKITKQYPLPKTDIHRFEVFMGANNTIKHEPNIKPSFGNYTLSHNGRWLVAGNLSGEGTSSFALWDLEKNTYVKSFQSKLAWSHSSLTFSPDDRYLVIYYGSTRGHYAPCMECSSIIDIWDLKKSQYKFSIPLLDRNNDTNAPIIIGNGDMYLNINNKVVQRWNIKREIFIDVLRPENKHEEVFSIIGNGGDLLAISVEKVLRNKDNSLKSATSWIEIWSLSKQKILQKINIMNKLVQGGLEFNTVFVNKQQLAVATRLNDIIIWDALSGNKIRTLEPTKEKFGFSYRLSSEGNGILISSGKFVQRWNISTGELLTTVNACQPDMPGLPSKRYAQLKQYNGFGSAKIAAGKVISAFSCPQGGRSKLWNMQTGESKAVFGKDYKDEWFWLNDQEVLKSTIAPPPM